MLAPRATHQQIEAKEGRPLLKPCVFIFALLWLCLPNAVARAQDTNETTQAPDARQRVEDRWQQITDGDRVDPYAADPAALETTKTAEAAAAKPKRVIGGGWYSGGPGGAGGTGGVAGGDGSSLSGSRPSLTGGAASGLMSTLAALGLVIALIFGGRWLWARMGGRMIATGSSPIVEVLSRTNIGPRNHVVLLRVAGRVLVVSETPTGTRTLSEFDRDEDVADLLTQVESAKADSVSGGFREVMREINQQYTPAPGSPEAPGGLVAPGSGARGAQEGRMSSSTMISGRSSGGGLKGMLAKVQGMNAAARRGGGV